MQLDVRDKSFDITFVNNWCREQYQEMLCLIDEITTIPAQYEEIRNSEKSGKQQLEEMKTLNTRQHEVTRQVSELRFGIIRELMETNGYEFDERWWKRKTDVDDLNDFMLSCMQKDIKGNGTKKK
jgi:hypothetical protein